MINDSGKRREFDSGAVRDVSEGVGRCDLMPLDVVATLIASAEMAEIELFRMTGHASHLEEAIRLFSNHNLGLCGVLLEVSKHFEGGAQKYGVDNWRKGIPIRSYIDSAVRHYLKHKGGQRDERHDRAFVWNLMCAVWTCRKMPELNDYSEINAEAIEDGDDGEC